MDSDSEVRPRRVVPMHAPAPQAAQPNARKRLRSRNRRMCTNWRRRARKKGSCADGCHKRVAFCHSPPPKSHLAERDPAPRRPTGMTSPKRASRPSYARNRVIFSCSGAQRRTGRQLSTIGLAQDERRTACSTENVNRPGLGVAVVRPVAVDARRVAGFADVADDDGVARDGDGRAKPVVVALQRRREPGLPAPDAGAARVDVRGAGALDAAPLLRRADGD